MSSAILYLAIVAIWACVLIPRWLRRDSGHTSEGEIEDQREFDPVTGYRADDWEGSADSVEDESVAGVRVPVPQHAEPRLKHDYDEHDYDDEDADDPEHDRDHQHHRDLDGDHDLDREPAAEAADGEQGPDRGRERILAARRRLLGMLLTLAGAAAMLAWLSLAAWWVVVPPFLMLGGYLLLLREAAKADAEISRRRAAAAAAATAAAEAAAKRSHPEPKPQPRRHPATASPPPAEIIDISERVNEDLYDQYTDAKLRAVGD